MKLFKISVQMLYLSWYTSGILLNVEVVMNYFKTQDWKRIGVLVSDIRRDVKQ